MTVPTDQERLLQLRGYLTELLNKVDFIFDQIAFAIERDDEAIAVQKAQKPAGEDLF